MAEEMEEALLHVAAALDKRKEEQGQAQGGWEEEPPDPLEVKLAAIRERKEKYSPMVAKALEYVDQNLGSSLTQADICRKLLVSTGHFSKCFKRETGVGFAAYVTMTKMEKARILLRDPKNRVNEVARMLGYGITSIFSRYLKNSLAMRPARLRPAAKKGGEEND